MRILSFTVFITLAAMGTQAQEFKGRYPKSDKHDVSDNYFGTEVPDPYRWLEDDQKNETKNWVKQQQQATEAYMKQIPFRQTIVNRLTDLWNYEKFSIPFKEGSYLYYFKNDGLQAQSVLYRESIDGGEAEVFLDPNTFSKDGTSSLSGISFSKDGALCAYQISEGGSDWRKVVVINTSTGENIGDTLRNIKFSGIAWKRNEGFYYSSYDKPSEGSMLSGKTQDHKLYYHELGTKQEEDALIFGGMEDPRRYVNAEVTEDGMFLIIYAANTTHGNELYVRNLTMDRGPLIPVVTDFEHDHHVVDSDGEFLYILTGLDAPNKRLVKVPAANPGIEGWTDVISETDAPLTITSCGGSLYAHYLKDAVSEVHQFGYNGNHIRKIDLPGMGTVSGFNGKRHDEEVFYSFTSYVFPSTIFRFNAEEGTSEVYKKPSLRFDTDQYESKQVFYTSKDGTRIPMMLTYKKGLQQNGSNPVLLYGYGGFNISLTPSFSISNIAFMETGGVYAVANIRGGGEYGDRWHREGTKLSKQNVFDDFIAAAEFLIKERYTSNDYLAIAGGSNGGLLVGACMTQRPELFRVCFPAVGVLDMLRYHKFTAGAGWAYDYGTADDNADMFKYLHAYSPVHNLKKDVCYPATMVMTADHDDRVVPAHSFKFAAALQAAQGCKNPALIRIDTKAGHGAGKPTSMTIAEQADKWAFLLYNMGLTYEPK